LLSPECCILAITKLLARQIQWRTPRDLSLRCRKIEKSRDRENSNYSICKESRCYDFQRFIWHFKLLWTISKAMSDCPQSELKVQNATVTAGIIITDNKLNHSSVPKNLKLIVSYNVCNNKSYKTAYCLHIFFFNVAFLNSIFRHFFYVTSCISTSRASNWQSWASNFVTATSPWASSYFL
jgi:hypothetical protein